MLHQSNKCDCEQPACSTILRAKGSEGAMALDEEITYWAARAEEERRMAASLPDGPPAFIHRALAGLYERAIRDKKSRSDPTDHSRWQWKARPNSNEAEAQE
jgi:hypothetical protein